MGVYFLLLFSYGFQTNDIAAAQALSTPDCVFCSSFLDNVRTQSGRGQKMQGGSVQVLRLGGTEVNPGKFFNIKATIREAPSQTVSIQGAVVESMNEATTDVDMVVLHSDSGWTIRELSYKAAQ